MANSSFIDNTKRLEQFKEADKMDGKTSVYTEYDKRLNESPDDDCSKEYWSWYYDEHPWTSEARCKPILNIEGARNNIVYALDKDVPSFVQAQLTKAYEYLSIAMDYILCPERYSYLGEECD